MTHSRYRLADRRSDADGISRRLNRWGTWHNRSLVVRTTRGFAGWTPLSTPNTAPLTLRLPTASSKVGHPGLRTPMLLPLASPPSRLDAAPKPGCPTFALQGQGRGCAALQLSPTARPGRTWASVFAGAKSRLRLPRPPTCRLSWRQFRQTCWHVVAALGGGWTPCPTYYVVAPGVTASLYHRQHG
jgi:hypothetical protein